MIWAKQLIKKPAGGNWWALLIKNITIKPYPMKISMNLMDKK